MNEGRAEPDAATASARQAVLPWVVWALGAMTFFNAYFQRVTPSVMIDDLMRDFAASAAVLGNLSASYFYAYTAMQIPAGALVDRLGSRLVLALSVAASAVGGVLFATVSDLTLASVGRLLVGFGCGFSFVGAMKLATQWFPPRRFALVSGLTMMLGMIGGVGGQAPVAALVALWGWRGTMMAAAVGALVLAAAIWFIVRDRPEAAESMPAGTPAHESSLGGFGQALRIRETWLLSVCGLAMGTPLLAFASLWAVPYLMAVYGLSRPAAAAMSSLVIVGWGAGAPVLGWLSDRLGRRKIPMLAALAIELIAFATLVYVPGLPFVLVQGLMFLVGLAIGALPVLYALSREHTPSSATGATLALVNMAIIGAGAIFQPVVGWLLDLHWDGRLEAGVRVYSMDAFRAAFLVIVASLGIGLLAGSAARETWCRPVRS